MKREPARRLEGSLLSFAILLAALSFVLVFLARTPVAAPPNAVSVNTASAEQLSLATGVHPEVAELVVERRTALGGFSHAEQPGYEPLLSAARAAAVLAQARERGVALDSAGAADLRRKLGLKAGEARRIVEIRSTDANRPLSPATLRRARLAGPEWQAAASRRLIVRSPAEALRGLGASAALFLLSAVLLPLAVRRAHPASDPWLLPLVVLLAGFGISLLYSIKDPLRDMAVHRHHAWGFAIGAVACALLSRLPSRTPDRVGAFALSFRPSRRGMSRTGYLYALLGLGMMLLLLFAGQGPGGVRLSLYSFQPAGLIHLALAVFLAAFLAERAEDLSGALHRWRPPVLRDRFSAVKGIALPRRQDIGPVLGIFAAALLMFAAVRDLGPALVLYGAMLMTLYAATGRSGALWAGMALAAAGIAVAASIGLGVLPVRMAMWRSPWENGLPNGAQLAQGYWGMASGGIFGSGWGLGSPGAIPRAGTDMALAAIGEDLGLFGTAGVLVVYTLIVWRGFRIALDATDHFDRLLAVAVSSLFAVRVALIAGGVSGLLPLSGMTIPFLAYGNSALVTDMAAIGVLLAISAPESSVPVGIAGPRFRLAVRRLAAGAAIVLLGVVAIGRLAPLHALGEDQTASRTLLVQEADGVVRSRENPRLRVLAQAIPRGSLQDRNGEALATSRLSEISRTMPDDPARARKEFKEGRYYPFGESTASVTGYLDPEIGGPTGAELAFNPQLRGFRSYADLVSNYRLKDLPATWFGVRPRKGEDVRLSIDARLQVAAAKALNSSPASSKPVRGAVVVVDVETGELMAAVSTPGFDPNSLNAMRFKSLLRDERKEFRLLDRSRQGLYPPGSTIKVATAASALEHEPEFEYVCRHTADNVKWSFGGQTYARKRLTDDEHDPAHNRTRLARGLRVSCNLYFAHLGLKLGPERLHETFSRFGLSRLKQVAEFAEDLPDNAYGQGTMLVTPLEMARFALIVANHGREREIGLLQGRRGNLGAQVIAESSAASLAEWMRDVVERGTARGVFDSLPVEVAGKTGTAENEERDRRPHSWFIGFAPASRSKVAFACIVENGGYGRNAAAPVMREVLKVLFP